jgi:ankyrin repeat protein
MTVTNYNFYCRNNHGNLVRLFVELEANLDLEESEHGYTPLMLALVLGHEWVAAELILAGANVRYLASNGRSPMFVAAEKGLSSIISLMVSQCGVGVNEPAVRPSGLRMIHVAAFHKQPVIVSQLIRLGANVNQFDDENGYSPLSMAILGLNTSAALELIEAGANVKQPSRSGRTPLYVAVEKGLVDVVKTLLAMPGVDINAPVTSEKNAARPLHVAILYGQCHLIPVLINLGADVNLPDDERKCSPLLMATLLKDSWSVKLLLRANANPCQLSKEGRSALYIAAEKGFSGILRLLVEDSSLLDINGPVTSESHRGTALHIAAMFDNAHLIIELLSLGADVNTLDALGRSAAHIAKEMLSTRAEAVLNRYSATPLSNRRIPAISAKVNVTTEDTLMDIDTILEDINIPQEFSPEKGSFAVGIKASLRKRGSKAIPSSVGGPPSPNENSLEASTPLPRRNANDYPKRSSAQVPNSDSAAREIISISPDKEKKIAKKISKSDSCI